MKVLQQIEPTRNAVRAAQRSGMVVGVVPTMGALHDGHVSLIRAAKDRCSFVAVTIFVNPTQFSPNEDFDAYPRTSGSDLDHCREHGVDLVFAPDVETMFPTEAKTTVRVADVTAGLCGPHRPGHFDGVATVVAKLFSILPGDYAFFGEKDFQQLVVIRRMVRDLNLPIEIVGCPTVREPDGIARSSRNVYLTGPQRIQATSLSRALFAAEEQVRGGETSVRAITDSICREILASGPVEIEYVGVVDPDSLADLTNVDRPARICVAARIGSCRLIDNVAVTPCEP